MARQCGKARARYRKRWAKALAKLRAKNEGGDSRRRDDRAFSPQDVLLSTARSLTAPIARKSASREECLGKGHEKFECGLQRKAPDASPVFAGGSGRASKLPPSARCRLTRWTSCSERTRSSATRAA